MPTSGSIVSTASYQDELAQALERAQAAERANHAKSEFIANLSYKLRTPLSAIMGMAQLLSMDCLLPKQQEWVTTILNTSEYILSLLDDLFHSAQLETGTVTVTTEPFDLRTIMQEIVSMLDFHVQSKNLHLVFDYPYYIPSFVLGDAHLIRRIILSLSTYIINKTDHGTVLIQVLRAHQTMRSIELSIRFKAMGELTADELQQIHICLQHEPDVSMRYYNGIDLGLSMAIIYLKWIAGALDVSNQLGSTLLQCSLPFKLPVSHQTLTGIQVQETSNAYHLFKPLKVLLIEDDSVIQRTYQTLFEKIGCSVDFADSAKIALERYKTVTYDLILMDIGLSDGSNGIEITQLIRDQESSKQSRIPIIALTAHGYQCDHALFLNSGIDAVLVKPVDLQQFHDLLVHWTAKREESTE